MAVYTTVLNNRLTTTLTSSVGKAAINAVLSHDEIPALVAAIKAGTWAKFPGLTITLKAAIAGQMPISYGQAFKTVYLASIGFGGIAIIGSSFTLDARQYLTDKG